MLSSPEQTRQEASAFLRGRPLRIVTLTAIDVTFQYPGRTDCGLLSAISAVDVY